jgi:hypothetical protein
MKIYLYNKRLFLQETPTREYALTFHWCFSKPKFGRDMDILSMAGVYIITYWLFFGIVGIGLDIIENDEIINIYVVKTAAQQYNDETYELLEGLVEETIAIYTNRIAAEKAANEILSERHRIYFDNFVDEFMWECNDNECLAEQKAKEKVLSLVVIDVYEIQENENEEMKKVDTITFDVINQIK